jgi:hypothetical protein
MTSTRGGTAVFAKLLLSYASSNMPVTLTDENPAPNARTTATIKPSTAIALVGHLYQHTPSEAENPLTVERIVSPWRACLTSNISWKQRRILVGDHTDDPGSESCLIEELCGHVGCNEEAPAGPGSRCSVHYTDPVPAGWSTSYWAELGIEAWARAHKETGEEGALVRNRRNGVVLGGVAAGMEKAAIHRLTGIARTTIDRILDPVPDRQWEDDDPNGPA